MKKIKIASFLFFIALLFSFQIKAQTNVSGGIFANTTWTLANSPYIVTGNIVLFPGFILTIQPGVIVKFSDSTNLEVRQSKIIALGTNVSPIIFTSNAPSPIMGIWDQINLNLATSARFDFCQFYYAKNTLTGFADTVHVTNSFFSLNKTAVNATSNTYFKINGTTFRNNNTAIDWNGGTGFDLDNSIFIKNQTGFMASTKSNIRNCVFDSNYVYGILKTSGDNDTVRDNEIKFNPTGYSTGMSGGGGLTYIHDNVIDDNGIGIYLAPNGAPQVLIQQNCICFNTIYNLKNETNYNVNAADNCWCVKDSVVVDSKIYDAHDNVSYGIINFMPFDTVLCSLLSVPNYELKSFDFEIFPNPASSDLEIFLPVENSVSEIKIYNLIGETEISLATTAQRTKINVASLASGIYVIEVKEGDKISRKKFVRE
jgi:hypothetical protein